MGLVAEVCPQRGALRCILLLSLGLAVLAPSAQAADEAGNEDVQARIKALQVAVTEHKKEAVLSDIHDDVKQARELYEDHKDDPEIRKAIVDVVGSLTKGTRDEGVVIAGLHGLGDLGDPLGAKYVRSHLRQRNLKEASDVLQAAVATAAEVVDESLVAPLMKIALRSKTFVIAADAIESLGHYGRCKRKRTKILRDLVDSIRKNRPGGAPRMRGTSQDPNQEPLPPAKQAGTAARWNILSRALPGALNMLTGQDLRTVDDWMRVVKDSKNRLDRLFQIEDPDEDA